MIAAIILEYKDRGFTNDAVKSVLSQTVRPDKIVLTSADAFRNFDGVEFLHDETESLGERIYNAVSKFPADYYAFLEDDDVWLPDHIKNSLEYLKGKSIFYSSAIDIDYPRINLGAHISNKIVSCDIDFNRISKYSFIIDTVLYLQALDQNFNIITNYIADVHYRFHGRNWSINSEIWKKGRDKTLMQLPLDYPTGKAHEIALQYLKRDYGH